MYACLLRRQRREKLSLGDSSSYHKYRNLNNDSTTANGGDGQQRKILDTCQRISVIYPSFLSQRMSQLTFSTNAAASSSCSQVIYTRFVAFGTLLQAAIGVSGIQKKAANRRRVTIGGNCYRKITRLPREGVQDTCEE